MMAVKRVVVWVGKIISVVADHTTTRLGGLVGHMCLLSPGVDVVLLVLCQVCMKGVVHIMKYLRMEMKRYSQKRSNSLDILRDERRYKLSMLSPYVRKYARNLYSVEV